MNHSVMNTYIYLTTSYYMYLYRYMYMPTLPLLTVDYHFSEKYKVAYQIFTESYRFCGLP